MKIALVCLSLAVALSTGMAAAQGPAPEMGPGGGGPGFGMHRPPMERTLGLHGPQGRWWNDPMLVEKLKLTDQQRKEMDQILLNHREKLIDMRASVDKAELAMEPLVQADQPNEGAILAQIDRVAQARAELEKANARFLLAIRAKLTPDQWKELRTARAERRDRRGWRNGPKTPNPPPPGAPGPGPQGMVDERTAPDDMPAVFDPGTR